MLFGIDASRYGKEEPTGVELYTDRVIDGLLSKNLNRKDVRIRLYVAHLWQVEKFNAYLEAGNVDIRFIECGRFWTQVGLSREMESDPPDVLFVPSHVLPRKFPKKSVVVIHGLEALRFPKAYSPFVRWYQKWTTKHACRHATKLVAVSHAVKQDLVSFFGCDEGKIEVVYEGVNVEQRGKGEYGERRDRLILSVGRIEERKNQIRLLEAFSRFAKDYADWKLVFAGPDGYGADKVHDLCETLPHFVRERVQFLGHKKHEEVLGLMKKASIFAYPSLAEGFGLPILEAMSTGTPVLTSNSTACAEIGGNAVLKVDPLSVDDILDGILKLASDEKLRASLVLAGFERISHFSWDACVEKLNNAIFSVLKN